MDTFFSIFKKSTRLNAIFISNILLSFHYYLTIYINSSFLNGFFSETQISTLYIIGACITTLILLNISKLLEKIGNRKTALYIITLDTIALLGILVSTNHFLIGFYFVLMNVTIPVIWFNLDIFLEGAGTLETETGIIRGVYLTLSNITLVIAPAIAALLLFNNTYIYVYTLSFLLLFPLFYAIKKYSKNFKDSVPKHIQLRETLREYLKDKRLNNIFAVYFLLQLFYAYMVVYTPLYLEKYLGFPWSAIGIMFTIMLLPFVLFELPVGNLSDRKYGEKEFMTIGLIVMGLSTMFISFVTVKSFLIWTVLLFITRTGASFVEITTDSYFFKLVDQEKTEIISIYRLARPLSFIVAPIMATLSLQFIPFEYTFIVIGTCMILGTRYSLSLQDSK